MHLKIKASREDGFTLTELLVSVTVLSIVLAVGVPSFSSLIARNRISSQTNEFIAGLNLARSEAVRRAQTVTMRSSGGEAEYATGWDVFTDADGDGAKADGDVLVRTARSSSAAAAIERVAKTGTPSTPVYTVATSSTSDRMYVVFNGRGGNDAGTALYFRVCDKRNSTVKGRVVQVSTVGRVSVIDANLTCPSS